jgi:hypothetical protein
MKSLETNNDDVRAIAANHWLNRQPIGCTGRSTYTYEELDPVVYFIHLQC